MSEKAPAFQFYPKDYTADENVALMSLEQEGAYIRLLCHAWLQGSIPADVPSISRICRTTPAKMARLWSGIKPCWKDTGEGRLVNGRQERERRKQEAYREQSTEKGKKGAAARWLRDSPGNAPAIAQAMPGDGSSVCSLQSATNGERALVVFDSDKPPDGNSVRPAFADAIWAEFLAKSEQPVTRLMSPREFAVLKGWQDAGIPLRIVLRGLEDTKGKGSSLAYYGPSVQVAYERWRQAVPGGPL